jgi:hypothetical protein
MFPAGVNVDPHSAWPGTAVFPVHFEVWISDMQIHFDRLYRFNRRSAAHRLRISLDHLIDSLRSTFTTAQCAAETDEQADRPATYHGHHIIIRRR